MTAAVRHGFRLASLAALLTTGCAVDPTQSTLHPAGPAAAAIAWLWWAMLIAFTATFVLVVALMFGAVYRKPAQSPMSRDVDARHEGPAPPLGRTGFIVAGGVILPIAVLTPLFLLSLGTSTSLRQPQEGLTVRVIGRMWWWEVRYPDSQIVTANEIHIPAGRPVRLVMTSTDVIHSFWVPRLHGKRDMIPGLETNFWVQADQPGVYRGQCGEYCGTQHANMAFQVIAMPSEEFDAWLTERTRSRAEPASPDKQRGYRVFMNAGCAQCHAIEGTPATGNVGPDLTHLGSRRMIGAAMLPNTRGNLAGWIADPQAIKPGVKMPRSYLAADDLLALVSYLEGLQ